MTLNFVVLVADKNLIWPNFRNPETNYLSIDLTRFQGKKKEISRINSLGEWLWGILKNLLIRLINLTQQVRSPIRWGPTVPSQPRSICPLRKRASLMRSGRRPFRSTEAKQPWKPSRETTSFGRFWYMLGPKPPTNRSPGGRKDAHEFNYSSTVKLRLGVGFVVGYLT